MSREITTEKQFPKISTFGKEAIPFSNAHITRDSINLFGELEITKRNLVEENLYCENPINLYIPEKGDEVVSRIQRLFYTDHRRNNSHLRIERVLLSPRKFAVLYLDGHITFEQMQKATEEGYQITVPNITFNKVDIKGNRWKQTFNISTMPSEEIRYRYGKISMATLDIDNDII